MRTKMFEYKVNNNNNNNSVHQQHLMSPVTNGQDFDDANSQGSSQNQNNNNSDCESTFSNIADQLLDDQSIVIVSRQCKSKCAKGAKGQQQKSGGQRSTRSRPKSPTLVLETEKEPKNEGQRSGKESHALPKQRSGAPCALCFPSQQTITS